MRKSGGSSSVLKLQQNADGEQYEGAHVIVPRRTDHDASTLEVIAPVNLRDTLGLTDDVTVDILFGEE